MAGGSRGRTEERDLCARVERGGFSGFCQTQLRSSRRGGVYLVHSVMVVVVAWRRFAAAGRKRRWLRIAGCRASMGIGDSRASSGYFKFLVIVGHAMVGFFALIIYPGVRRIMGRVECAGGTSS